MACANDSVCPRPPSDEPLMTVFSHRIAVFLWVRRPDNLWLSPAGSRSLEGVIGSGGGRRLALESKLGR